MVKLDKIYTRGGDKGKTSLGNGERVYKNAIRIDAFGTVDETNSVLGIAIINLESPFKEMIFRIQNDLFDLGADLCVPESDTLDYEPLRITQIQVDRLEKEINNMNSNLEALSSFILPGGTKEAAYLHLARTTARKAERLIINLTQKEKINPICVKYINRLSDHLFVTARLVNKYNKKSDILWVPGKSRK
jgi:cob(I)alamin adenosyltransferase